MTTNFPLRLQMLEHGADPNQRFTQLSSDNEHSLISATGMVKPLEWETEVRQNKLEGGTHWQLDIPRNESKARWNKYANGALENEPPP